MAARRRGGFSRGRTSGKTDWGRIINTGFTTIPAGTKALMFVVALSNPGIMETIRRTRGMISIASDQAAGLEAFQGAVGFMVINDIALAAGAASIPGPVTDDNDDGWFVWQPFMQTSVNVVNGGIVSRVLEFDSKAMRKVEEGFGIAVMVENSSATTGFQITTAFSMLSSRT